MAGDLVPIRRLEGVPEELSDEALIAACALGDRAALGALFDRHAADVRMFLLHYLSHAEDDVDDLVQVTFEIVQKRANRFQGRSSTRTWLLGVARNVARRHVRTEFRRRRLSLRLLEEHSSSHADLEEHVFKRERLKDLRAAIRQLSPARREAFVLVYVQGLSGVEAAKVLGVREGTLWKRLCEARKRVLETLGDEE